MKKSIRYALWILILAVHGQLFCQPVTRSYPATPGNHPAFSGNTGSLTGVAPLLSTRWAEGCFYNASCPVDAAAATTCLHVPAGPGAIAMAQIMKYYGYPETGSGEHGYPHPVYGIQYANFGATTYHWSAMPDTLTTSGPDLATLIYHCGVAQDMDYGTFASTSVADNIDSAFVKYFKYPASASWKSKSDFPEADWMAMVQAELDAGHPLLYSGTDSLGSTRQYFICDGYDGPAHFHFNWGRGGVADGFYTLDNLMPDSVKYSFDQKALFGLAPSPPAPSSYVMDFENLPDFSLTFGDWTALDMDQHETYGITGYSFPHQSDAMAFLCFNPAEVTPSMATDQAIQPHGGERFGACFSSNPPANNDWFISPRIQLGINGSFSFWVKSYSDLYGLDSYKVAISVTGNDPPNFTVISGTQPLQTTLNWTKMTFNLSDFNNQQVYVAIQCVSDNNFLMMIDDLEVKPEASSTLVADFAADKTSVRVGEYVSFSDQSSGGPVTWLWKFTGGTPALSELQNPTSILYSTPGTYPVSLKVSNGQTSDSVTKNGYITVTGYPVTATLDFETIPDFSLSFTPWTVIDVRGGNTYGINQAGGIPYYFPHVNEPMAFICFNPAQTTPPIPNIVPRSGQKLGCCISSYPPMNPNDKWLITPKVSLGLNSKIEFWVKAFNDLYGPEKYNVAVSLTNLDPDSFIKVNGAQEVAPLEWTLRSYDLSYYNHQDVYIGIQCVTDNSFIFMIDDIMVTSSLDAGELSLSDNLIVFPNPARDNLVLYSKVFGNHDYHIELLTLTGVRVAYRTMAPDNGRINLDIHNVPQGLYLLSVTCGLDQVTRKVSILNQ